MTRAEVLVVGRSGGPADEGALGVRVAMTAGLRVRVAMTAGLRVRVAMTGACG